MTKGKKANAYLMRYRYSRRYIESLKETLAIERSRLEYHSCGGHVSSLRMANFKELEKTILQMISKYEAEFDSCILLLDGIADERCRKVMKLHYIEGLTLEETADKMFYSRNTIIRIHKKGLDAVADLCNFEDD